MFYVLVISVGDSISVLFVGVSRLVSKLWCLCSGCLCRFLLVCFIRL